jgi:N6-adenosine-specific RNA methylase IME4
MWNMKSILCKNCGAPLIRKSRGPAPAFCSVRCQVAAWRAARRPFANLAGQKFGVIAADPPWHFKTWTKKGTGRSAEQHYDTMSNQDIKRLPVADLAARDCALFLWVVDCQLDVGLETMRAWGFKFVTRGFDWVKYNHATGKFAMGMGMTTRTGAEQCLLGTRGSPRRLSKGVRQVIAAPRREHSRKPDEFFIQVETLFAGPYLELFARQTRPNWVSWGLETKKFSQAAE